MTILASDRTVRLSEKLHDLGAVRWPEDELWRAIDDAQNAILEARPDLFDVTEPVQLILGPKQPVPTDCFTVFDIPYNLNADKDPVSEITKVERTMMDRAVGGWMTEGADTRLEHWMQGEREKKYYWVYPPAGEDPSTGQPIWVEMRFARRPEKVTSAGSELATPDEMINGVYYFAMTRLLEKDEKFAGSKQADMFLTKFGLVVGARTKGEKQANDIRETQETT